MIVDASIFVALHIENDVQHDKAVEAIRQAEASGKILVTDYIINEVATVTLRKGGLKKAKEVVERITNNENVIIGYTDQHDFSEALRIFKNQTDNLSFVDCTIIHTAKTTHQRVATFDNNLLIELNKK